MDFKKVHSDDRRTIYADSELLGGKEISFIKLNKGKSIGGCMHANEEYCLLLEGDAEIFLGNHGIPMQRHKIYYLPSGLPHGFVGTTDCLITEYGISSLEKEGNTKDEELSKIIAEINGS